jgi:hypothetical protein
MTKKGGGHHGGGGRRRKNSKDISEDEDEDFENDADNNDSIASSPTDTKSMSFADRRDFQRKAAADKRRQKMKVGCLCGDYYKM